jgi:DNA mismatch repair protein MutH
MQQVVAPPASEAELLDRALALAGRTLSEVAAVRRVAVPTDLRRDKGWIGQLLESVLGATAAGRAQPDFPGIGVELKTLPVSAKGSTLQSTWVCTAPLDGTLARRWEDAWLRRKLSRVLWMPIVGTREVAVGDRVVGSPLIWSPSPEEEADLRADWEELSGLIHSGELWQLDARRGKWLQIRPKGARGSDLVWTLDEDGEWIRDTPRGFYLRARFTRALLARHFATGR